MKVILPVVVLVVSAALTGCASPSAASGVAGPPPAAFKALDALAVANRHDEIVARADDALASESDPFVRAGLELRRARALQASGHPRSATLAFQHAVDELPGETGDLAREVNAAWGDVDVAERRWRDAVLHYDRALDAGPSSPRTRDDLIYSGFIAARESGDKPLAAKWKARLRVFSPTRLVAVESRILPPRPPEAAPVAAKPKLVPGVIPDDPGLLIPGIHHRADWSAAAVRDNVDPMTPIVRITVHHSAMPSFSTWPAAVASEIREIQIAHQGKGWADVGYHFIIDAGGGVWEARPLKLQGAHEGAGLNRGAIGVCLLGNFEETSVPAAQQQALERVLDALCAQFGLRHKDVVTHREVRPDPTDCPGHFLQDVVERYRRATPAASLARQ